MNRTKSAFKGAISSQIYTVLVILLNLVTTPFILGHLDASIYGLSIVIFQITSYLGMFDFGLTAGVERFLAGTKSDSQEGRRKIQEIISTSFIVYAILGILVILVGLGCSPYVSGIFDVPDSYTSDIQSIVIALSCLVGVQFLLRSISGIFFAHQRQLLSNTLSFFLSISNIAFTVLFIYLGYELWSFVFAQVLVFLVNTILNLYIFRKSYPYIKLSMADFRMPLLKEMFSYGFYLFIIGIAVQIVFQTDRILIGSLVSLSAVSIYALTSKLPEMASQFIWKITDNSFPAMVELSKGNDMNPFRIVHDKLMDLTLSLSTTAFWLICFITAPFLKLWVGDSFFAGQNFVFLVGYLYLIQLTFIHVSAMCLNGAGIAKQLSYMSIFEAVLNLGFSIYLAKRFGLIGVLYGTVLAGVATSFWYVPYLTTKFMNISINRYIASLLKPILFCSVFDGCFYFIFRNILFVPSGWGTFILYFIIVSFVVLIPMIFYNRNVLKEYKSKLFNKSVI